MVTEKTVGELEARTEQLLRRAGDVTTELREQTDELVSVLAMLRTELFGGSGQSKEGQDG
jgi:hypothetical protein